MAQVISTICDRHNLAGSQVAGGSLTFYHPYTGRRLQLDLCQEDGTWVEATLADLVELLDKVGLAVDDDAAPAAPRALPEERVQCEHCKQTVSARSIGAHLTARHPDKVPTCPIGGCGASSTSMYQHFRNRHPEVIEAWTAKGGATVAARIRDMGVPARTPTRRQKRPEGQDQLPGAG